MKKLEKIIVVDFFLYHAEVIDAADVFGFLGPNGTGKSAILDAIQIVLLGADRRHLRFNAKKQSKGEDKRTLPGYCLGQLDGGGNAREEANTYLTLVFRDEKTGKPISIGTALRAEEGLLADPLAGLYVVDGAALTLDDHVLSLGGGEIGSLPWSDFRARLDELRSPTCLVTTTDRNEQFVRTALHALQAGHKPIDMVEYVKALRQSLTLSSDKSASDFVRDVLVTDEKINRSKARDLVRGFQELKEYIRKLIEKIEALGGVARVYRAAAKHANQYATLRGLAASYGLEWAAYQEGQAKDKWDHLEEEHAKALISVEECTVARDQASRHRENTSRLLNSNAAETERRSREAEVGKLEAQLEQALAPIKVSLGRLRKVLAGLAGVPTLVHFESDLKDALHSLHRLSQAGAAIADPDVLVLVNEMHELLVACRPDLEKALRSANDRLRSAEQEVEVQKGMSETLRRGGKILPRDPNRTIGFLSQRGFEATPVCDLVSIREPDWQVALEAFLKDNRFALIVRERTAGALALLRGDGKGLPFTKIAQPMRANFRWNDRDRELIGNLLEGDEWAVAALRMKLGQLRKAHTEEDLLTMERALSKDGWCSTGGMTERLPSPAEGLFLGGAARKVSSSQDHQLGEAQVEEETARKLRDPLQSTLNLLDEVRREDDVATMETWVKAAAALAKDVADGHAALAAIDLTHVEALKIADDLAKDALAEAESALRTAGNTTLSLFHQINDAKSAHERAGIAVLKARTEEREAHALAGYDAEQADVRRRQQYQQAQLKLGGDFDDARQLEGWIQECRTDAESEARRARDRELDGHRAFNDYIGKYGDTFHEDRSDFRYNLKQVEAEKDKLEGSELKNKKEQADEALKAAEQAFRRDIALKVRDAISRMDSARIEMNRILGLCPPFSNNERYKFHFEVVKDYEKVHAYIMNASNEEGSLFGSGDSETTDAVFKLIEQAADPEAERASNPLDDFRLMFHFDLHVYQGDKKIGSLSKRMGTGSNGEHLTPYYVVIGATLAHAYRLDAKGPKEGFGLMIIDEAFAAMDPQNALATAQFLSSLGLQLVMGCPEDSLGKIGPFTDHYYNMYRSGLALSYEKIQLKKAGQALLRSDMPGVHPELVTKMVTQMRLDRGDGHAHDHAPAS